MKQILKKWNQISLILRIVIGLTIGIILGLLFPQAQPLALLGTVFVGALRAVAPILVFILVMSSLAQSKKGIGSNMRTVIILYVSSTLVSAFVAVAGSFLFPQTITVSNTAASTASAPSGIGEVLHNLLLHVVANPVTALTESNFIGILVWAVIFGLALKHASEKTKQVLSDLSGAITKAVQWIISLAPFGILGLVYDTVSNNGLSIFVDYGKLILLLIGCMLFIALVSNPLLVFAFLRSNPYPLVFTCLKESAITAFFTRSSAANIPMNMALCKRLGLNEDNYSVSIPLGATINMDGAAVTITVMTLAAANTLGISVDLPSALILSILATISACGASGVAGGSLLLIPLACSLFGIPSEFAMQVVGIGFIIGVVQDSFETALNSSSDALFTITAEYYHEKKAKKKQRTVP